MNTTPPRLAGPSLRLVATVLRSPLGAALRRGLARQLIERYLDEVDFAAEGDPAPYHPVAYRPDAQSAG
jgi:hypothetical protein